MRYFRHAFAAAAIMLAAACATSVGNDVSLRRKGLEFDKLGYFELPMGAGSDLASRNLALYFKLTINEDISRGVSSLAVPESQKLQAYANQQLESLMARMKRFKCYSLYNSGGRKMVRELAELGEMQSRPVTEMPAPDVILNLAVTFGRVKERMQGNETMDEVHIHRVTYSYNMTDASGQILTDARDASHVIEWEDPKYVARIVSLTTGKTEFFGGFNPDDVENVHNVFEVLFSKINNGLEVKLGRAFPVTAKVTGLSPSGTQFAMAAGSRNGVFSNEKAAVWYRDPAGFDIVLADVEIQSSVDRATLKVIRWSRSPDAAPIVRALRSSPANFAKYSGSESEPRLWASTTTYPGQDKLANSDL